MSLFLVFTKLWRWIRASSSWDMGHGVCVDQIKEPCRVWRAGNVYKILIEIDYNLLRSCSTFVGTIEL